MSINKIKHEILMNFPEFDCEMNSKTLTVGGVTYTNNEIQTAYDQWTNHDDAIEDIVLAYEIDLGLR